MDLVEVEWRAKHDHIDLGHYFGKRTNMKIAFIFLKHACCHDFTNMKYRQPGKDRLPRACGLDEKELSEPEMMEIPAWSRLSRKTND